MKKYDEKMNAVKQMNEAKIKLKNLLEEIKKLSSPP